MKLKLEKTIKKGDIFIRPYTGKVNWRCGKGHVAE